MDGQAVTVCHAELPSFLGNSNGDGLTVRISDADSDRDTFSRADRNHASGYQSPIR